MAVPISLVVEDEISEHTIRQVLAQCGREFTVGNVIGKRGSSYLRSRIVDLNRAARGWPFLVLTDLDRYQCPAELVHRWLSVPRHPNLLFRVAVQEVEAWLLADRSAFATFLGISRDLIPDNAEQVDNPKEFVVSLARRSRKRDVRESLVPREGSTARVGRDYNGRLVSFVNADWQAVEAQKRSPSLKRTMDLLRRFDPQ
jgi:hypothetical protein